MDAIMGLVGKANGFLWGMPMLVVIAGGGIFLSVYLGFFQFVRFKDMWSRIMDKSDVDDKEAGVSAFASFCTTMAMRVGTGNVAGVAVAVYSGGPGALFWMFLCGITNSAVNFVECVQGSLYKTKIDGEFRGGPHFVAQRGLGWGPYGAFIAILSFIGIGFFMPAAATNTVCVTFAQATGVPQVVFAGIMGVIMFVTCLGGTKKICDAASAVVPFMVVVYLAITVIVIVINVAEIPRVLTQIVTLAFTKDALLSGGIGVALQQGVKRATFSSASGMGEATPTAAIAVTSHPVKVGLANAAGVWVDTCMVCMASGLLVVFTDCYNTAFGYIGSGHPGLADLSGGSAVMVQYACTGVLGGVAEIFVALMLFLFTYTCLISYFFEAETSAYYLFQGEKNVGTRKTITWVLRIGIPVLCVIYGIVGASFAWDLSDFALGAITFFNMLVVLLLCKPVKELYKDYCEQMAAGKDPVFDPDKFAHIKGIDTALWKEVNARKLAANK